MHHHCLGSRLIHTMIPAKLALRIPVLLAGVLLQLARPAHSELVLEQVQVLFRHGERTPRIQEMYPNDPYNISTYDPIGLGHLTNKGKMTEYHLGKMLRLRYDDFLGNIYRPNDILAVSSDVDRTKMSLMLVLAGLYPPSPTQIWNSNLLWMPIPIHYAPQKMDMFFKAHENGVYMEALKKVRNSEEIRKKMSIFSDLFKFLSEKTGINIKNSSQVFEIFHLLTSQKAMNLVVPDWCTDEIYNKIREVVILDYDIRSYTTQLKRLHAGSLIKKFIQNMNLNNERNTLRKMYLYSGHEVNIAAFTKAHNLSEPKVPAYGSAILVEKLRNTEDDSILVRMLLWTGGTGELISYKLEGCNSDFTCPINKYLEIVRNVTITDEDLNLQWSKVTLDDVRKYFTEEL